MTADERCKLKEEIYRLANRITELDRAIDLLDSKNEVDRIHKEIYEDRRKQFNDRSDDLFKTLFEDDFNRGVIK